MTVARRPLVGVSASFMHADPQRALFKGKTLLYAEQSLLHWVMSAGAVPVLLPTVPTPITADTPETPGPPGGGIRFAVDMVQHIDGLLLQGGADMSPRSYGEEPLKPEWAGDAIRDRYEMELVRLCMERGKPILGVCRGTQVLNVAMGGTLYQDIQTLHEHKLVHRNWEIYDQHAHDIAVEPESWLGRWYGATPEHKIYRVNSVHHQGINRLGEGLVVEARSLPDGIVEAVRYAPVGIPDAPWVYGVQWHPEFMQHPVPDMLDPRPLLQAFLEAVNVHRGA